MGVVVTEQNNPSGYGIGGQPITSLTVVLGAASDCGVNPKKAANIQLGLYKTTNKAGTELKLVSHTKNHKVTISEQLVGGSIELPVVFNNHLAEGGQNYFIGFATDSADSCLQGVIGNPSLESTTPVYTGTLPTTLSVTGPNPQFQALSTVCVGGTVSGDPVFTGFNGQQFAVKGVAGQVFNVISSPTLSFNNRFVQLDESMSIEAMQAVRAEAKQHKLKSMMKGVPPVTTAWSHAGTYLGESGIILGENQLYIAPGAFATGFSSITLNGVALPISSSPVELDGDMTVTHSSAYKVQISTPSVRFTIVNADNFVNIEHARVMSAETQLTGLLGQTADAEWEVVQSAEFVQHVENDYIVANNELF